MNQARPKVLVIGWDAADWKVINALTEQGKMPHTAALVERGVMGNLATLHPVLSPMLWTSIATGKRPFKHGILGFTEPTPDGGGVQPVSQLSRTTKAVWNILNQEGYRSHVIGWWPSHPVEPINGVMVSNHYHTAVGPPEQPWPLAPGMVHPERVQAALAEVRINPNELVAEQILPFVPRALEIDQDKDRRLASVMKILAECASVNAAATWAMANEPWDFMGVYYDAIDHFSHGFMKYHPPRRSFIPERDYELYHGVVEAGYRFHDMMLGAMLALAPQDTTVIICSDHGFHPDHLRPAEIPNEPAAPAIEHRDLGVLLMAGPGIRKDALIHGANLLDITPTILSVYGLPVGEDMDGKPLLDAFESPPQVARIPSWDDVAGEDGRIAAEQQFDPIAAKEAMDQLVALGYIEQPDENREKAVSRTVRELRYNLARSYMDAGRHADAVATLEELYEAEADQFRFGVHLAMCYQVLNKVEALRALVERMTRDRQEAARQAQLELEALREEVGARQVAAGDIEQGADPDPAKLEEGERKRHEDLRLLARFSTFDLDYLMGWVLIAEGDPGTALVHLHRAQQAERRRPGLYVQIGEAYLGLRQWDAAESAFRRALAIDPLNPWAHLGRARACLQDRSRAEEAVGCALECVQLLHHYPYAHYVLGLGLLRMGRYPRAIEAMEVAVSLNPNFERAHRVLARYHRLATGNEDKVKEHLQMVKRLRAHRRARETGNAGAGVVADLSDLAAEPDSEGRQLALDAAPNPAVDKSAVPKDPGRCVTVVSGLPRSGTSMMMQMLAAGGVRLLTDDKREADVDNPRGYLELESATRLRQDREWVKDAKGKAVKVVAQLLPFLPDEHPYRVVFMERDLEEVMKSQKIMLDHLGRKRGKVSEEQLARAYRQQLRQIKLWLAKRINAKTLFIAHREAIEDPQRVARKVSEFLGGLDVEAMAAVVDRTLYRQRVEVGQHP